MKRSVWIGLAVGFVVAGTCTAIAFRTGKDEVKWRFAPVSRGDVTQRISATGTLNALIQVPVGTQVSGVVTGLYADFNSLVKKGQVIARIDPTLLETQLRDAEAALQRSEAAYQNAKLDYERNRKLYAQKLIADSDLDAKDLALKTAKGNLASAKANLAKAKTSLSYCTITAPVDGVVVSRLVDEGQTVAASFSTPNLFTIAQDLSKMKAQAAIDEADIGQVRVGQQAFFTVDSYPDRQFKGTITEVQLNPVVSSNVVTYNVIMEVTNEPRSASTPGAPQPPPLEVRTARYIPAGSPIYKGDLALFPGMTANISITTRQSTNVLKVPNAALRFNPAAFLKHEKKTEGQAAKPTASQSSGNRKGGLVIRREDKIWVLDHGKPKPVLVKAGVTDGQFTEVAGESVQEGLQVLIGVEETKKAATASSSPMPLGGAPGPRR